ncbi:MAG: methionine adenosyltransferase, partial [Desulfobacterales bacterium]|nr:methionine adenosyltransferase [Desulfobacterales bacterium]
MLKNFIFNSESVTEGHPDKLCDQISDAIVDNFLEQDPYARVRAECAVSSAIVFIAARFRSKIKMDFSLVARKVIKRIGYEQEDFNDKICSILTTPNALPVEEKDLFNEHDLSEKEIRKIAARNQVTVFGFACNHTPSLMPYPIWLAHQLARQLTAVRRTRSLPYLMPDGKVQVGVEFQARQPKRIHSVTVTANQRDFKQPSLRKLRADIREQVVVPIFEDEPIQPDRRTKIIVNPEGPYFGGPTHHSGLTGRKNAIDTYGEFSRHSGKALSGKDPLRIDRIGAYAARYAAKNVVAAGLATECEILLSYTLGTTQPVSLQVQTFGTG